MGAPPIFDQSKYAPNPYPNYPPPPIYSNSYPIPPRPPPPYAFAAPPPAAYYSGNPHNYQQPTPKPTFAKFILTTMLFLLIAACAMSFLTWLLFGSITPPNFSVKSLSVPSFNVSDTSLTAVWDVNVTVANSNSKLDVSFERLETVVVYDDDTILGLTEAKPFHVSPKGEAVFEMIVSAKQVQQGGSMAESFRGMAADRRRGAVTFRLRMAALATLTSGSTLWRRQQVSLKVFCEDLEVKFDGPMGPGKFEAKGDGRQKGCVVYA